MTPLLHKGKWHIACSRSLQWYMCQNHFSKFPRKAFHTSPRYQFLDTCLSETHTLLTGLHAATGLSWAATLPLTALLVRVVLVVPVTTYVHLVNRRRLEHQPLIQAWAHVYRDQVMREHAAEGPAACQKLVSEKLLRKSAELYKKTGTQRWKTVLGYLQLPVWLTIIETIRRMCGIEEGLLGMIRSRFFGNQPDNLLLNEEENSSKSTSSEPGLMTEEMQVSLPESTVMPHDMVGAPLIPVESTLATEGAFWFPNLLIPDPHVMLSFILSASLLTHIFYQEYHARIRGWRPSAFQSGVGFVYKIGALAIGPFTLSFPSAIHLYLISTSVFGLANTILLRRFMPVPATWQPRKQQQSKMGEEETSIKWEAEAQQIEAIRKRRNQKGHQA
ncbi:MAG: hypothetical protein LQ338_002350 [Usnochroma carphineum]|nr:MAG: hypothetical protein LQ338_002350 [Usnochroma carphineum]